MNRPQLVVCVGAAKAGTTSLYALMKQHPRVAVTRSKETDFFFDRERYSRGCADYWDRYFEHKPAATIYFEADPIYMYAEGCVERIQDCAPDARLVVMLRNPVDRAYSQYLYRMVYARYEESFEEMCRREAERVRLGAVQRLEYGCLDRSLYAPQIRNIFMHFPRERVHFMVFERFVQDQSRDFGELLSWLGLATMNITPMRENARSSARSVWLARLMYHPGYRSLRGLLGGILPPGVRRGLFERMADANRAELRDDVAVELDPELRRKMLDLFRTDVADVERLTGLDLGLWFEPAHVAAAL
jgi:hypothetical protein